MSTLTFRLSVVRAEGSLERVLGVVRRRRLGLERMSVDQAANGLWDIAIRASASESEAGLALRQFNALIDVRTVNVDEATT
jgi:acetolactate synthase regulatory subunit